MFYHFGQNNTGGSFDFDKDAGITHHTIIEAESAEDANARAESIGLYFDGCSSGNDCPCCGDRWYKVDDADGEDAPMIYSEKPEDYLKDGMIRWMKKGFEVCVHFANGEKSFY